MEMREKLEREFARAIQTIAGKLDVPTPDMASVTKEALLKSDAFMRSKHPVIAVTGITHTGKSSLINALFGEKTLTEGLTADETDFIMKVQFQSGLIIYDTPGGGGIEEFENITRAFLQIEQLEEDLEGKSLSKITAIPMADAHTYQPTINGPKIMALPADFEQIDLILFVVSVESSVRREDRRFFHGIASRHPRIIVVINKVDMTQTQKTQKIEANKDLIRRSLKRDAVAISAHTGEGLEQLAVEIHKALPNEYSRVLGETIDSNNKRLVKQRQIDVDSIVTAIKTSQLIKRDGKQITNVVEYASNILGLYGLVINQYVLSERQLKGTGIDVIEIWSNVEQKMQSVPNPTGKTASLAAFGLTFGAIIASVVTGGALAIPLAIGAASGGSIGTAIGLTSSLLHRSQTFESSLSSELSKFDTVIKTTDRLQTVASIIAFGRTLREYCELLERGPAKKPFLEMFERHQESTLDKLKPYAEQIMKDLDSREQDRLIREMTAAIL
jgi:predicted GTPase